MDQSKTRLHFLVSLLALGVMVLVVALSFAGGMILSPYVTESAQAASIDNEPVLSGSEASQLADENDILGAYESALNSIYEEAIDSVVYINVSTRMSDTPGFNAPFDFFGQGQGSGFVWDKEGHIITNHHVIEGADQIDVTFHDGRTLEAEVIGSDPESDLAVLKVDRPASDLLPLPLGDNSELKVGQLTIAIGNPFGQEFTMTSGIVSALGRTIRSGNSQFSIAEVIQTDAAINPGNSGGPLLNRYGEVIGINTMILSRDGSSSGVGFAVPASIAERVIPRLIEGVDYEYAWLGIRGMSVTPNVAEALDLPADTRGAMVIEAVEDGPADQGGLLGSDDVIETDLGRLPTGGDIILSADGEAIESMDDLITYLADKSPEEEIELGVLHADGEEEDIVIILGVRPISVP